MVAFRVGFASRPVAAALLAGSWAVCIVTDLDNSAFAQSAPKATTTTQTPPPTAGGRIPTARCPELLDRTLPRLQDDAPQHLCQYAGRAVLVVNTASYCGFTQQYEGLEALFRRYRDRGFVVLGFPSNDFGQQEPGTAKQIADFCFNTYGVAFPMFAKTVVVGPNADPLFAELGRRSGMAPKWNFHKWLIGRDGAIVAAYPSSVEPLDPRLIRDLERTLAR
jgi:glutathione peroxidase